MLSGYREFLPHRSFAPWIECFWTHGLREAPVRVLPDTCVDFVFSHGRGLQVVGTMTRALVVDPGKDGFVGVRFRAGTIGALLKMPLTELTDRSVRLQDIWGAPGRALEEQLRNAHGQEQMIRILQTRIEPAAALSPVHRAINYLVTRAEHVSLEETCRVAGLSARQFRRRCLEETGVTPKHLARISRFRRAWSNIGSQRKIDWATVAVESGYYDQAHLIHEFQKFSGNTPGAYAAQWAG